MPNRVRPSCASSPKHAIYTAAGNTAGIHHLPDLSRVKAKVSGGVETRATRGSEYVQMLPEHQASGAYSHTFHSLDPFHVVQVEDSATIADLQHRA